MTRSRSPFVGLVALVLLGLVAAFFGWVSADPFWLALGRGAQGTVTVTSCEKSGMADRCEGNFTSPSFRADDVRLSGLPAKAQLKDATAPAKMLGNDRDWAYAGPGWTLHLRWGLGLLVALLCGVFTAVGTGARYLRTLGRRARWAGLLLSFASPLLLFAGLLCAALL